jgi:lipoate-protein ligase A
MNWHFVNTGFHSGEWNMMFDENLAQGFDPVNGRPVLRVYGWQPHTISLGANQRMDDFDLRKIYTDGIDIVRRPTGGRAIYHAHELTYSVVIAAANRSARDVYHYLSRGILASLRLLGIDATVAGIDERLPGVEANPLSIPCFSTSTRNEIQWNGKKIVGSAQRRYGNTILQHGSFLLGPKHQCLCEYLTMNIGTMRTAIEKNLAERTIDAETILHRPVSFTEAATALQRGFEQTYNITFLPYDAEQLQHPIEDQQLS